MPRARTIAVLVLFVVAPVWLATGHAPQGGRWRGAVTSLLQRPLETSRELFLNVGSVIRAPWLRAENQRLRRALVAQQADSVRAEELSREVVRLQRLLQLKQEQARPSVAARVIGRDATPWFRTVLVDVGRQGHLEEGSAVVVDGGLVGQLFEVGPTVARVLLVTDPRFRIGAIVQRSRAQGIALGTVSGRCYLAYITSSEALQVGDVVLTSGVSGMIPKGLVIGTVVRIERDPSGLYWQAQVQPSVDPTQVEEVVCLP